MECNKDEALRAKEISERKLAEKDYLGSKKFVLKAEKLFPGLEGLSQLLIILDVYISSEKIVNGELDWYSVLGVDPTADDETIRKNYRKLALALHPDKNKCFGAEGAFKLVSQAWTLLSDKIKKKVYDQKRHPRPVYQKPVSETPCPPNPDTFWTSCTKCLVHFEYMKKYSNVKIVCQNCSEPFWAREMPVRPTNTTMWSAQRQNHNVNVNHNVNSNVNVKQGSAFNGSTVNPSKHFKSRYEAKAGSGKADAKRRRVAEQPSVVNASNAHGKVNSGGEKLNVSSKVNVDNSTRELSQAELRNMLMMKARKEIHKKVNEWNAENAAKEEALKKEILQKEALKKEILKKEALKKEIRKKESAMIDNGKKNAEEIIVNGIIKDKEVEKSIKDTIMNTDEMESSDENNTEAILMSVPDPDFHDFDMDRTENSFNDNEIWAAYDEDDGMPRYYAMIHNVITKKPFKVEISWLNSKSNAELGPINWVSSGFPKTNGDYRIGKHEINTSLNSFSHKVQWLKAKKGVIQIYPKEGDVWALYKNWSPKWNEFTPDETIHKYEMVVILDDFTEGKMVISVAPLVKVSGFKSVFYQHAVETRRIPKEEIFRLSHQVPFYKLTGEESVNLPKGSLELDPAALPMELLQMNIEEKVKTTGDQEVQGSDLKKPEVKGVITYVRKKKGEKANVEG